MKSLINENLNISTRTIKFLEISDSQDSKYIIN